MDKRRSQGRDNRPYSSFAVRQGRNHVVEEAKEPPQPKRRRVDDTNGPVTREEDSKEEEDLNLMGVMEGDEFVSQEEKEAEAARLRRLKRRQRLQQTQEEEPSQQPSTNQDMVSTGVTEQESNGNHVEQPPHEDNDDNDGFDMFSSSMSPPKIMEKKVLNSDKGRKQQQGQHHQQDWDDEEGYYKATIGEEIKATDQIVFRVLGIVGKGVFSTVLKCETCLSQTETIPKVVGIKLIRHNETMAKAALSEIRFLQKLRHSNGIVQLHLPLAALQQNQKHHADTLEHRGHTMLVFDYAPYNLRHVLRKFGRGVGLSLTGVKAYFVQLLQALLHLRKHNIIHADLKPDNVLVSEDFGSVQLCDFGSAFEGGSDNIPTPYLVSRFYRAPEIILGLLPTTAVDLWSVAATIGELFLGRVLFDGHSNNDMLLQMMETLGIFSNRMLRQHAAALRNWPLMEKHFDGTTSFKFVQKANDKVTGQAVTVHQTLTSAKFPKVPLQQVLLKAKSANDSRVELLQLSDLMSKCLTLDPSRRIEAKDALQHLFFQQKQVATKQN